MRRPSLSPQRLLALCTLTAVLLALLPARLTAWADALQGPVDFFFAPVTHAASFVSRTFRPAQSATLPRDPDLARIVIERDELQTQLLDADRRVRDLERLVRELQGGLALAADARVLSLSARVIGSSSDLSDGLLTIRAGTEQGVVERDTIAIVNGVHLVGRVESATGRTCRVRPITRPRSAPGWIQALVFPPGDSGQTIRCQLRAGRGGTLMGDLAAEGAGAVAPGQVVRLQDPDWPEAAQMLILGRIESVAPKEGAPLRQVATVRPDVSLDRVRRVVLRIPADSAPGAEGAAP